MFEWLCSGDVVDAVTAVGAGAADGGMQTKDWVTAGFALLALIVSLFSTRVAYTVRGIASRNLMTAQGNVIGRLLGDYAKKEMSEALKLLRDNRRMIQIATIRCRDFRNAAANDADRDKKADAFLGALISQGPQRPRSLDVVMREFEEAGRMLHWHIHQGDMLHRHGVISTELFNEAILSTNGFRLWAELWLPYLKLNETPDQPPDHLKWTLPLINGVAVPLTENAIQ